MADNTNTNSAPQQPEYTLDIDETVVEKITAYASQKVDGIVEMKGNLLTSIQEGLGNQAQTKGVKADVDTDNQVATIDVSVILEYGKSAGEVFDRLKKIVTKEVKEMTDLDIDEMTVHVVDVMTREEQRQQAAKQQEKEENPNPVQKAFANA